MSLTSASRLLVEHQRSARDLSNRVDRACTIVAAVSHPAHRLV
jgi:hypothetical protein